MRAKRIQIVGFLCLIASVALAHEQHPAADVAFEIIKLKNFNFWPATMHTGTGTTVIWKNLDGEPHTVVSDSGLFRSGGLDEGDSFQFTFDKPGTYRFFCSVHPHMMGTIVVE